MKKIILLASLAFSINAFAQDLIVKKNGEEINAKIIEVGAKELKYKQFTNIDGPTYTIEKSEIVFVKYKNGEKEIFEKASIEKANSNPSEYLSKQGFGYFKGDTKIRKREFVQILSTNEKAYKAYKSGKVLTVLSVVLFIPGYAFIVAGSESGNNRLFLSGVSLCAGGILGILGGNLLVKDAVKVYNKGKGMALNLNVNPNGVGLALKF